MLRRRTFYWFLLAAAAMVVAFAPLPFHPQRADRTEHSFTVDARQFSYSPSVLHVAPDDIVTINLTSTDVVHGLYLDGYGLSIQADPGQTASLTFTAARPGSFRFRCNVTCGAMHPFMIGKLYVGNDEALYRGIAVTLISAIGLLFSQGRTSKGGIGA